MTLVCRPTLFVRSVAHQRAKLKAIGVSHGTILEHGGVFTHGPAPWNPAKRDSVENVQKNEQTILFVGRKAERAVLPAGSAACIPTHESRALATIWYSNSLSH